MVKLFYQIRKAIKMKITEKTEYKRIFEIFEEICAIPHGSQNMAAISKYCVDFAKKNNLEYTTDDALNVVIYKKATKGYEKVKPVILQGHLDMVCQKTADCDFDFTKDALELELDGDFLTAKDTTLGGDNGIAVALIMALLERNDICHPAIEAVFTTDEEIGMIGATALDTSVLKGDKLINLDSEEENVVTVSCAGGIDFKAKMPVKREKTEGERVTVTLKGLLGGHSGVEIDKNRTNSDLLLGRLLLSLNKSCDFSVLRISGGDKSNAIPNLAKVELVSENADTLISNAEKILKEIKTEIEASEPDFNYSAEKGESGIFCVLDKKSAENLIFALSNTPNGIISMSAQISGLVETSLNLGILSSTEDEIIFNYALRSNKATALAFLVERMQNFYGMVGATSETGGFYPPWEYKKESTLRVIYSDVYYGKTGSLPKIEAIHAGLECAVFADKMGNLDCIAVGPTLLDVHTVNEKLSVSSTEKLYDIIIDVLKRCK